METITVRAHIGSDHRLTWLDPLPALREGEVVVTLRYPKKVGRRTLRATTALPVLDGKRYLGGSLSREEIYDDAR